MKQLKFMLAAATAISLAAAAQAATTTIVTSPVDAENFEMWSVEGVDKVIPDDTAATSLTRFTYSGEDDLSVVKAGWGYESDNALAVDTDGNPLLRRLGGESVDLTSEKLKSLNIDTMVKFTVTLAGDSVTVTDDDKLMIYLAEFTNDIDGVTQYTTNLVVRAAGLVYGEDGEVTTDFEENGREYIIDTEDVVPNEWYRLQVKARAVLMEDGENKSYWPVFQVFIGDNLLSLSGSGFEDFFGEMAEGVVDFTQDFVSLQVNDVGLFYPSGTDQVKLTSVGFAGEGLVDDIVITKDVEQETSADFTFTFTGDNLSSVTYTIGTDKENTYQLSVGETEELDAAGTITIKSIAFSGLYKVADNSAVKVDSELTVDEAGMEFAVSSTALTGDSDAKVPANTKPADIGIESTTGIPDTVPSTKLDSMIKWATANKGDGKETIDVINEMAFDQDGNPKVDGATTNVAAQAYLLNCAIADVPVVEKAFKFDTLTFTANGLPDLAGIAKAWGTGDSAKLFNGEPVLDYKAKLTDAWGMPPASLTDEESKAGFFRARLVLDDGIN